MRRKSNSASKEAKTMKRFGSATGSGSLRDGKGAVSTESQAMKNHPYRFFSRYGDTPGTNPEELVGAAQAACFTRSCRLRTDV
jgi:osmotically inducible protein OsmC